MSQVESRAQRLVDALEKRREDRGFMADLRRGVNSETEHKAWPHVAPWCDLTNDRQRAIYTTVMGSYAFHPAHDSQVGNFGTTLRRIALGQGGEEGLGSFEGRFRRILTCDRAEQACRMVAYVVRVAAAKGVPVDYVTLFTDLTYWSGAVKLRWARDYWSESSGEEIEEE